MSDTEKRNVTPILPASDPALAKVRRASESKGDVRKEYNPDQPRDDAGRFGEGGGGTSQTSARLLPTKAQEKKLSQKLQQLGGRSGLVEDDYDTPFILAKGKIHSGSATQIYKSNRDMQANQCHKNASRLFSTGKAAAIGTGYALSGGLWRQHSWGLSKSGKVLETTGKRSKYFGIALRGKEAEAFVRANQWKSGESPSVKDAY